jgi:hypothetical protein
VTAARFGGRRAKISTYDKIKDQIIAKQPKSLEIVGIRLLNL